MKIFQILVLSIKGHWAKNCPDKSKNKPNIANVEKNKEEKIQKVWKPKAILEKVLKDKENLENQESRMQLYLVLTSPG